MIEFARLAKLTCPMLEKVLTRRLSRPHREHRLTWIGWLNTAANFDIRRMIIFAGFAILAAASSKVVATIRLSGTERIRRFHDLCYRRILCDIDHD